MKWMALLLGLSLASSAWAVNTLDCPKRFTVNYDQLIPLSEKSFKRQVQGKPAGTIRELEAARELILAKSEASKQTLRFRLSETKQSQCNYDLENNSSKEHARLYSREGQDHLQMEFSLGQLLISSKHIVNGYSTSELEIEHRAVTPFFLILSESKYKLGWALGGQIAVP